ncbi:hypothetical protein P4O66_002447 [Electrophorus voltai]|uniref:Uncharacterized protein n=1 Tax=Electrophorus voltai TaxID=2609070 RepID=A0AAD8YXX8_9TELE|nr:hypothetical protein P4O66_002447 [Electrophorus voltai]
MILFILGLIFLLYAFRWVRELKQVPNISEKYVYITGCDTGFGNLLAKHLDILGFCVIAGCYTEKGEDELNKACSTRLSAVQLDVTDNNSISKATDFIKTLVQARDTWINMAPFGVKVLCIEPGCFKTGVTDIDVILNNVQKLWDRLPQDVKDDYGSSYMDQVKVFLKNKFVKMLDGDLMKVVSEEGISNLVQTVNINIYTQRSGDLVNNAGWAVPIGPKDWQQIEDFKQFLDVNLIGLVDVTALPVYTEEGQG